MHASWKLILRLVAACVISNAAGKSGSIVELDPGFALWSTNLMNAPMSPNF